MNLLPDGVLDRLIKLSGMMSSTFDGERATAAAMATELLRRHGLSWQDVLQASATGATGATGRPSPPRDWRVCVAECQRRSGELSQWENRFLADLRRWRGVLSPKQRAKLRTICEALALPPP
jgi:hypothetical protein